MMRWRRWKKRALFTLQILDLEEREEEKAKLDPPSLHTHTVNIRILLVFETRSKLLIIITKQIF